MINPVCNEYGNSYSKNGYLEHLRKNGKVDPLTKKALMTPIMYTNINLKKAIEVYLEKNPWAFD
jgi:STIP1 family protein 1